MIADAIKSVVPGAKAVNVDLASIRWTNPREGKRYLYLTPPSVQAALLRFDNGIKPAPFRFTLRNPAQVATSGSENRVRGGRVSRGVEQVGEDSRDLPSRMGGSLPGLGVLSNRGTSTKAQKERGERLQSGAESQYLQGRRRAFGIRRMARVAEEIRANDDG